MNEQVLVVNRKTIEDIGMFQGFNRNIDKYKQAIFENAIFMDRQKAEKDPFYKQIIPYVMFQHGRKYLSYIRGKQGGETRLIGGRSIGIGGHINPIDAVGETDFRTIYEVAVNREVSEEVLVKSDYTDKIVALINDDSSEVGSVHLGIVHLRTLTSNSIQLDDREPEVYSNEPMISDLTFMTVLELINVRDSMETWSQICLDILKESEESDES